MESFHGIFLEDIAYKFLELIEVFIDTKGLIVFVSFFIWLVLFGFPFVYSVAEFAGGLDMKEGEQRAEFPGPQNRL